MGQHLSLGVPAANQVHRFFCPIIHVECVPLPWVCGAKVRVGHLNTGKLSLEFQWIFYTILVIQAQDRSQLTAPNPGPVLYHKGADTTSHIILIL